MIRFYHYPKCSTCRKAAKWLAENDIKFDSIDISQQPPTINELQRMLAYVGGNIRKLFNTSGMQYRELKLKDKLPNMSDDEAIELLVGNGMLVKRPFLLTDDNGMVGFKEEAWRELLIDA